MIDAGAPAGQCDAIGYTPLHRAAAHAGAGLLRKILGAPEARAGLNGRAARFTPLDVAVTHGNREALDTLLGEEGLWDTGALTQALGTAAWEGRAEMMGALIGAGANVNGRTHSRRTPLDWAVEMHDIEALRVLLAHGAGVSSPSPPRARSLWLRRGSPRRGASGGPESPLMVRAARTRPAIVRALARSGAGIERAGSDGVRPLMEALARGDDAMVAELVGLGSEVDAPSPRGTAREAIARERERFPLACSALAARDRHRVLSEWGAARRHPQARATAPAEDAGPAL